MLLLIDRKTNNFWKLIKSFKKKLNFILKILKSHYIFVSIFEASFEVF